VTARTAALRAAVVKFLADRVAEANKDAKADVLDQLDAGDRKGAVLPDGGDVGTVSVTKGRKTISVTDEAAFLAWVREHSPHNIEVTERVRPAYTKSVTDGGQARYGMVVDPNSGEIIPGLALREGDPYVTVRQSDEQAEVLAAALEAGVLDVRDVFLPATPKEIEP
jgi:hypothetical protein